MTRKMRTDYLNLKEFNENAAHEIQTPLAIIRSKAELLMQGKNMRKENLELIKSINEATNRIFRLNKGLLLISKIDNQYYHEIKRVSLSRIIESYIEQYHEIMQLKNIRVEITSSSDAEVLMNDLLAEVLISNLIGNAVRYNVDSGFIKFDINDSSIIISNSGLPLRSDPEQLFRRFHKEGNNPQSVGLGLSIVMKITENYGMQISYHYANSVHEVRLDYRIQSYL